MDCIRLLIAEHLIEVSHSDPAIGRIYFCLTDAGRGYVVKKRLLINKS